MVDKANLLRVAAGVAVLDEDGSPVPFLAASLRAGSCQPALQAYQSFSLGEQAASTAELRTSSLAMALAARTAPILATFDVGRFNSSCVFEHSS